MEARPQAYVLAVSGKEYVWLGPQQRQVKTLLASLPAEGWRRLSAGDGAKGRRWYDWRWQPLAMPLVPGWGRWLLVRRSLSAPTDLTATVLSDSQINLSWTASTDRVGVTGYRIYRDGAYIATTTTTGYQDAGLQQSTTHTYEVGALDAAGNESARASVTATTQAGAG